MPNETKSDQKEVSAKSKKIPRNVIKKEAERLRTQALEKIITLVTGGFGLVAALAWNDAIKKLFAEMFGEERSSLIAQFGYAIVVTIIVVILSVNLSRLAKKKEKDKDKK